MCAPQNSEKVSVLEGSSSTLCRHCRQKNRIDRDKREKQRESIVTLPCHDVDVSLDSIICINKAFRDEEKKLDQFDQTKIQTDLLMTYLV